ncbi:MAG: hypothetical protein KC503_34230 [Myxococcales bacterium]|nr:hypothetical protein [Myxococcales bacterium]
MMRLAVIVVILCGAPRAHALDLLREVKGVYVAASSLVLNPNIGVHQMVDGDLTTAWNSRTTRTKRTWIGFYLPAGATLRTLQMTAGFTRNKGRRDLFTMNYRVSRVKVYRGKTLVGEQPLDINNRGLQAIKLADGSGGAFFKIVVSTVRPGSHRRWREICVSELTASGDAPAWLRQSARPPRVLVGELPKLSCPHVVANWSGRTFQCDDGRRRAWVTFDKSGRRVNAGSYDRQQHSGHWRDYDRFGRWVARGKYQRGKGVVQGSVRKIGGGAPAPVSAQQRSTHYALRASMALASSTQRFYILEEQGRRDRSLLLASSTGKEATIDLPYVTDKRLDTTITWRQLPNRGNEAVLIAVTVDSQRKSDHLDIKRTTVNILALPCMKRVLSYHTSRIEINAEGTDTTTCSGAIISKKGVRALQTSCTLEQTWPKHKTTRSTDVTKIPTRDNCRPR